MQTSPELIHWGIKGQKWGVRRYQNPDGTLTEEGKAHYMEAARKGKLDPTKLSDEDLNMINNRFQRENAYQQNVEKYQKSTFSYKMKDAIITRVKGNGGGGKGGKKGKNGKSIGELLLTPISKAFQDALKMENDNDKGGNDKSDESLDEEWHRGMRFVDKNIKRRSIASFASDDRINTGKSFAGGRYTRDINNSGDFPEWNPGGGKTRGMTSEEVIRNRQGYKSKEAKNAEKNKSNKRKKRAKHFDDEYAITFVVTRENNNDNLIHHGIKGQKWYHRRFQNEDGTWTAAGKERYGDSGLSKKEQKKEAKDINSLMSQSKKAYKQRNTDLDKKLYKSEKIQNLANDEQLIKKFKSAKDLLNQVDALRDKSAKFEKSLGVYGEDFDAWDPKTGKEDYGINEKQYNEVMKLRDDYKKARETMKPVAQELLTASKIKSENFVKEQFSKSYSKIKPDKDSIEEYSNYVNRVLINYLGDIVSS